MKKSVEDKTHSISTGTIGLVERFDRWLEERRRNRAEAYLAEAESLYDLEYRMRRLAKEMDHPRFMSQV